MDVLNFLEEFEDEGLISLDRISADLSNKTTAKSFRKTYMDWRAAIKEEYLSEDQLSKIFNKKGDTYIKIFGIVGIVVAGIVFYFTINDALPAASYALVASIILGLVSVISLLLPQKIGGAVDYLW